MQIKSNAKNFIGINFVFFVYSIIAIFTKLAARHPFFTLNFILFYGIALFLMLIYSILWQRILKNTPLIRAYAGKCVVIVWGLLWGVLIFKEQIKWNMIVGAAIIIIGTMVAAHDD